MLSTTVGVVHIKILQPHPQLMDVLFLIYPGAAQINWHLCDVNVYRLSQMVNFIFSPWGWWVLNVKNIRSI